MRQRIIGITELIDEIGAFLFGDLPAEILVVLRVPSANVRAGQNDFRAHRTKVKNLFLTHLVRQDENQLVALLRGNQCQPEPCITCCCFHQGIARLDVTPLFGLVYHRHADSILDRATRIHEFKFEEEPARAGVDMRNLEHGRTADHVENVGENLHVEYCSSRDGPPWYAKVRCL
jgi:hypothetical protein